MKKAFIVGGVTYDSIIRLESLPEPKPATVFSSNYYQAVGGTGAGKALNVCRLGFDTVFHGMIGEDDAGKRIKECFADQQMSFIYDIDPGCTETHTNLIDNNGNRISVYTTYATFKPEMDYKKFESYIEEADFVVLNIINYVRNLILIAKEKGKKIWCDIHDYDGKNDYHLDFIKGADYVFVSSDQLQEDYRTFMQKLVEDGKELVVCTHGKNGASALDKEGNWYEEPIIESYEFVSSDGAGDSFFSGFIYGYAKGEPIQKCLQYASIAAGLTITSKHLYSKKLTPEFIEREYVRVYA